MTGETMTAQDIWTQIEDEHICMMATSEDGVIKSRPMGPMPRPKEGLIWFTTHRSSGKIRDLADGSPITLTFQNSAGNFYVSMAGAGSVVDDRAKAEELWNPALKQWFEGPHDPELVLIAFEPSEADYWDGPNRLVAGLKMALTAVTGMKTDMGEVGKVHM